MTTIIQLPAVPNDIPTANEFNKFFGVFIEQIPPPSDVTRINGIPTELIYVNDLTSEQISDISNAILGHLALTSSKIQTVLDLISTRRTQIVADLINLDAATSLAQAKPIIQRMLNAEDTELIILDKTYRYFRWANK